MPIYQYRCAECERTFERTETISEHEQNRSALNVGVKDVSAVPARVYVVTSKKS